jgi:hypothetical protein
MKKEMEKHKRAITGFDWERILQAESEAEAVWEINSMRRQWNDPQEATSLCLELLDTVAKNTGEFGADNLFNIIEKAADKLLALACADAFASRDAAGLLAYAPKIFVQRACMALGRANPDEPNRTASCLIDSLIDSLVALKREVKRNPRQFNSRSRLFWPSLRAVTDSYTDGFDEIKMLVELSADYGFKRRGAIHLESPAVLTVAECLIWIRWIQQMQIISGEIDSVEKLIRGTKFPPLTKSPKIISVWWENGVKPLLESELKGERMNRAHWTGCEPTLEKRFADCRNRKRVKSDSGFRQEILKDCKQALETLAASPVKM